MRVQFSIVFFILAVFCGSVAAHSERIFQQDGVTEDELTQALLPRDSARSIIVIADPGVEKPVDARPSDQRIPAQPGIAHLRNTAMSVATPPSQPAGRASILITFKTNSMALTRESRRTLNKVANVLRSSALAGYRFNIEGHSDARGNPGKNLRLSQARAAAVRQYLLAAHHISPDRLVAVGKGDREPLNEKNPLAPENRRVTFITVGTV